MTAMHVLIVSTFFPFPQNCGKARVLGGLCAFLAQHPRVSRLSYFHIARKPAEDKGPLAPGYRHEPGPAFSEVCRNLAGKLATGRLPALQEAFTFSRGTRRRLWSFIEAEQPDVIVADTIRAAQYLQDPGRPSGRYLLYLDDLFSLRYERILELMDTIPENGGNALGNFVSFVPRSLQPLATHRLSLRMLLSYERRAVARRENEVVRHFARSFLINPDEVELLRQRSGSDDVFPLKMLTEPASIRPSCDGASRDFVFLGDLQLPHNRVAIENLMRDGAAEMARELPGYRVVIVGKGAPRELVEACQRTPNFTVAGFVPDLHALLRHARGLLAPLIFGSGVKIKCLEALRMGVPLVASRIGVEGLSVRSDIEYLHAEDAAGFIRQMKRLTDDAEHARIGAAGHAWFVGNYAPDLVWREYEQLLLNHDDEVPDPLREEAAA